MNDNNNDHRRTVSMKDLDNGVKDLVKHKAKKQPKQSKTKNCLFSLNEKLDEKLDELSLVEKKTSRSDIVKAGIFLFMEQSKAEQRKTLESMKQHDLF